MLDLVTGGLFGGIIGGLFRLAPELLKFFNGIADRKHEATMLKLHMDYTVKKVEVESQMVLDSGGLEALRTAIEAQGKKTGVKWVDALSASVRPIITYWYVGLYSLVKIAVIFTAVAAGLAASGGETVWNQLVTVSTFIRDVWTVADMGLLSGIINFWFLDRVIRKNEGRI
jgi:hypothetical protein